MIGDVLRVSVSIAMFHALAQRRLWTYLGLELVTAALIGLLVGIGTHQGQIDAPYVGYVATYGVLFATICARFLLAPHLSLREQSRFNERGGRHE
jgi:hypothetical protein